MSRTATVAVAVAVALALTGAAAADRHASPLATMPFASGPLPGSPQLVIKVKKSARYCGGVGLSATRKKSSKTSAPDPELAAVFALKFPSGLDFDPEHDAKRKASLEKFSTWYTALDTVTRAAVTRYRAVIADTAAAPADKLVALARLVQAAQWATQVIGHAEIPAKLAKIPEAAAVYCGTLVDKITPVAATSIEAATECRAVAAKVGAGWWDQVCAP